MNTTETGSANVMNTAETFLEYGYTLPGACNAQKHLMVACVKIAVDEVICSVTTC